MMEKNYPIQESRFKPILLYHDPKDFIKRICQICKLNLIGKVDPYQSPLPSLEKKKKRISVLVVWINSTFSTELLQ